MAEPRQILLQLDVGSGTGDKSWNCWMRHDKLEGRGRERHGKIGANLLDLCNFAHDGLWGRSVVVLGARLGASRKNAGVEAATHRDGYAALLTKRQKAIERILLQQCIASREKEAVEVSALQRFITNFPLVDADADRFDEPFAT